MKKLLLIALTVAGGLFVQTATPPERPDHDTKATPRYTTKCNKKIAGLTPPQTTLPKHI